MEVAFKRLKVWMRGEVTVWGGKWLSEVTQRPPGGLPSCPLSKHGMATQELLLGKEMYHR